ncbi:MAG: type II secretion system protein, partial [Limisphaerales bacterium]
MRFHPSTLRRSPSAFTLVEVAISLAIIGIALVAIIGVLPMGMNVQRDNREATVVNQDATIFLEAIRNGSRGLDDLTNYVYAITNYWTKFDNAGLVVDANYDGYTLKDSRVTKPSSPPFFPLTNGLRIVGLLGTPQLTDLNLIPASDFFRGGYSNHIIVSVRSFSGPAVDKPPQDNELIQADAFGYRIYCVNAPVANYTPPLWLAQAYDVGAKVSYLLNGHTTYWYAVNSGQPSIPPGAGDEPTFSSRWVRDNYPQEIGSNLHELRLTFLWPVRPNGRLGTGRQTYRALIAGQVEQVYQVGINQQPLYFYQSQSFTNAP